MRLDVEATNVQATGMSMSVRLITAAMVASILWIGCGSSTSGFGSSGFDGGGESGAGGGPDATVITLGGHDSGKCAPSSCAQLKATCGPVADPKCGNIVQCGNCPAGQSCGGGGVHNHCGSGVSGEGGAGDGCVKLTCADQHVTCGATGDGCNGMLECGSCTAPQTCGGNPMALGQCGCTGECALVPTCEAGTTTLTGKVLDPAAKNGLYNALVYVPNNPSDPGLAPFPPGITCDVCGATAAGDPLVTAYTAADGTFTLSGVPVGPSIPLVIQLGRWRRQFTIPITNACAANTIPAGTTLSMPQNHSQGDLPRIAFMTGSLDPVECVLRSIGVDASEFGNPGTNPATDPYFQFYTANDPTSHGSLQGAGAVINASTPSQNALFAATGGPSNGPIINQYDIVILECEGYSEPQTTAQLAALSTYAGAGGRLFASDYQYIWYSSNSGLSGSANWDRQGPGGPGETGVIDPPPGNPVGTAFQDWLQDVGVSTPGSGTVSISPVFESTTSVIAPTQQWLHWNNGATEQPIHFTFNTPIGATSANQCGRVTFSDWHAGAGTYSAGTTFPAACTSTTLSAQEAILEFMLFDLSACVQPYTPVCTPTTCEALGVECGPAGNGCGGLINGSTDGGTGTGCGTCPSGQTCGGGGAGKCGSTATCTPETCASQNIQCGPAGDGCGHEIQCGNCPTGDICGLAKAGQCGSTSK